MWLVRWFGRQDPDPRRRWQESRCATLQSASALARRVALEEGVRVEVKRIEGRAAVGGLGERSSIAIGRSATGAADGICRHELRRAWCALCRS